MKAALFLAFGLGMLTDSIYHYLRPVPPPIVITPNVIVNPRLPGMEFCT